MEWSKQGSLKYVFTSTSDVHDNNVNYPQRKICCFERLLMNSKVQKVINEFLVLFADVVFFSYHLWIHRIYLYFNAAVQPKLLDIVLYSNLIFDLRVPTELTVFEMNINNHPRSQ